MGKFIREPMMHFILGGVLLYFFIAAYPQQSAPSPAAYSITLSDKVLTTYLQFQNEKFDTQATTKALAELTANARQKLETDYIRSEALYREALALGLDQNDEEIRARLIEKISFIAAQPTAKDAAVTPEAQTAYFKKHASTYSAPAQASFTHVFFNGKLHGMAGAFEQAERLLPTLRAEKTTPQDAAKYGDRFHFLRTYANRPENMVSDHFGADMRDQIFSSRQQQNWIGPFWSRYGAHLLHITSITPRKPARLTDVRNRVITDLQAARQQAALEQAIDRLVTKYTIIHPVETAQ